MILADLASAALGPSFSGGEAVGLMAFAADLAIGPLSAVVLTVALLRRRWSGWTPVLAVLGVLNVGIAATILLAVADGLGAFVVLVGLQGVAGLALLVALTRPQVRAKLSGD